MVPALRDSVSAAIDTSLEYLKSIQAKSGAWEGEMEWSPVITAQYVIVRRIVGEPLLANRRPEFVAYFARTQTADGGWGLHPESNASLFVTTLVYVALRFLGESPTAPRLAAARALIAESGTPLACPTWGKLWLAFCNLYEFEGINPVPPELWLLPSWLPFHPARFYCHTRLIYLGMSYLWGKEFRTPADDICLALRKELYGAPYESVDFGRSQGMVSGRDRFVPPSRILEAAYRILSLARRWVPAGVRRAANARALSLIEFEQRSTDFAALSPVNGLLNVLSLFAADPRHPGLAPSLAATEHWLWRSEAGGSRLCGARSQVWDTAFVAQAACIASKGASFRANLACAAFFIRNNRITSELEEGARFYRSPRRGGWCFSDARHGWPVSDTTGRSPVGLACDAQARRCRRGCRGMRIGNAIFVRASESGRRLGFVRKTAREFAAGTAQSVGNVRRLHD